MGSLEKTAAVLILIALGLALKVKLPTKSEQAGIKKVILNLALPATIFVALLSVDVRPSYAALPFFALALNAFLFFGFPVLLPLLGLADDTPEARTAKMLVPSFAPGLSCFPLLVEYLGDEALAQAAMTDLGNKVFVLVILYVIAMSWHSRRTASASTPGKSRLRSLVWMLATEPVNLFIGLALALLAVGYSMSELPRVVTDTLLRLSAMMTPLVLLFIGLAVQLRGGKLRSALSVLLLRAGMVVFASALFIGVAGLSSPRAVLVTLAFGLSACSFWPFLHLSTVDRLEDHLEPVDRTFDTDFGVNMLALSFPLSTALIVGLLSTGPSWVAPLTALELGGCLLGASIVLVLLGSLVGHRFSGVSRNADEGLHRIDGFSTASFTERSRRCP